MKTRAIFLRDLFLSFERMSLVSQIDAALEAYYDSFQHLATINNYKNQNIGKFASYCQENGTCYFFALILFLFSNIFVSHFFNNTGIDDEYIKYELENGVQDCFLIEFDVDEDGNNRFPLNKPICDETEQNKEIYRIIRNMYIDAISPITRPSQVL